MALPRPEGSAVSARMRMVALLAVLVAALGFVAWSQFVMNHDHRPTSHVAARPDDPFDVALLTDAEGGISYEEPSPNTFSFNSPYGACPHCKGLGDVAEVDRLKVIPDDTKSINEGGILPLGAWATAAPACAAAGPQHSAAAQALARR